MDKNKKKTDDVIRFDDEVAEGQTEDNIESEISKIFKTADGLIEILDRIVPQINSDKIVNEEAFLKIIRPLCINVENTMPLLMDCLDSLETLKEEESSGLLRQKIARIEDDLLPPLLDYIKTHSKK